MITHIITTISVLCRSLDINSNINPTLLIKFVESGRHAVNLKSINRSTRVLSYCTSADPVYRAVVATDCGESVMISFKGGE